jgi:hypothetical protein
MLGSISRFAFFSAAFIATNRFVDGDVAAFSLCMVAGGVASVAQMVFVPRERQMPYYLPMAWATIAAAAYSARPGGVGPFECFSHLPPFPFGP